MSSAGHKSNTWIVASVCAALLLVCLVPAIAAASPPTAPSSLVLTVGAEEPLIATLAWTASTDPSVVGYDLYVATSVDGPYELFGTTAETSAIYGSGLPGMRYYFQVAAVNDTDEESSRLTAGPVASTWSSSPHIAATATTRTCEKCHSVHRTSYELLYRWEVGASGTQSVCLSCHDGRNVQAANVATGMRDSFALSSGHSFEPTTAIRPAAIHGCETCHQIHGSADVVRMIPARSVNNTTVVSGGSALCLACHTSSIDWFGTDYPSTSAPDRDATGYPVAGTWPGPGTYNAPANTHSRIPETTQAPSPGSPVRRAAGDCLYCHAAHRGASAYDSLLARYSPSSTSTLVSDQATGDYAASCFACHGGAVPSGFTTAPVNIRQFVATSTASIGHSIVTSGGTLPVGAPLPCYDCHNPHGSERGNVSLISDERGGALATTSAVGVRQFCFTCHSTADSSKGWDSSSTAYTAVGSEKVEGIPRSGGVLKLPVLANHNEADATSCYACHGNSYAPGGNNVHDPSATGGYSPELHTAAPQAQGFTIASTFGALPCSNCHALELGIEHSKTTSAGHESGCSVCHPTPRSSLTPAWDKSCTQGFCHTALSSAPMHANIDASHTTLPVNAACTTCHNSSLADIHTDASTAGGMRTGCMVCHSTGVPTTKDCMVCHPAMAVNHYDVATHTGVLTSAPVSILGTDFGSHACSECHASSELGVVHTNGCTTCHRNPAASAKPWDKSCVTAGCHTPASSAPMHGTIDTSHTIGAQTCTEPGCHSGEGNIAAVHAEEGCATCHGSGKTPTLTCTATGCHVDMSGHGDVSAVHAANVSPGTVTFFDGSSSHANDEDSGAVDVAADCTLCHGSTNLLSLHGDDCSVCHSGSTPRNTFTTWNKTCSQGSCHPSYHDNASPAHDAEYDGGNNCSCHGNGIPESSAPLTASDAYCGACHATGPDTSAPSTVSNALSTYVGPALVTLTATDDRAVKSTYYILDGAARRTLSGTAIYIASPTSGAQAHTLEFWSTDWVGNIEALHGTASFLVSADTSAPVTTSDAQAAYAGLVTIQLTATDNATNQGVKTSYYRFDGGANQTGATATLPQPAAGTETRTIYFWSVDYAGNIEAENSATFTVTTDGVAPTTTTNLLGKPTFYAGKVFIDLYAIDPSPSSGVAGVHVDSTNAATWWGDGHEAGYNASLGCWQIAMWPNANGDYPVTYYAYDNVGNIEPAKTMTITVDRTAPVTVSAPTIAYGQTFTGPQTFNLSPNDAGGSGLASTWYSLDGGAYTQGTSILVGAPASGTALHTLFWYSLDNAGNKGTGGSSFYVNALSDTVAPVGSVTINAGSTWTNSTATTLAPSATDAVGVTQMQFSNDNVTWSALETYSGATKNWALVGGNGTKTVYARYRDAAGNVSAIASDTIGLDGAAPVTTSDAVGGSTYIGVTPVAFTSVDLGGSGVAATWWQLDSTVGTWTSGNSLSVPAPAVGIASHTLYWYSRDNATNQESTKSVTFNVAAPTADTTPPSGSVRINDDAAWTTSASATLTLSASDPGGSGLYQMRFSNDNSIWSGWETYALTKGWTLASGDGTKTVYAQYTDNSGNASSSCTDTIVLDSTAPTTTSSAVEGSIYTGTQLFSLTPTDTGGSGVASTWYQLDGGAWTVGTLVAVTAPSSGSDSHTISWYSIDAVTNREVTKSASFTVAASIGNTTLSATLTTSSGNHAIAHFIFYDENDTVIGESDLGLDEHTSSYSLVVPAGHAYAMFVEWQPPDYETFDSGSAVYVVTSTQALPDATVPWVVEY